MQLYQAYIALHAKRILPIIEAEYTEYLADAPDDNKIEGKFKFRNRHSREMLADEPQEVRDELEKFRQGVINGTLKTAAVVDDNDNKHSVADVGKRLLEESKKQLDKQIK